MLARCPVTVRQAARWLGLSVRTVQVDVARGCPGIVRPSDVSRGRGALLDLDAYRPWRRGIVNADHERERAWTSGVDVDLATCGYATTPTVAGLLMGRQRFAGADMPLWLGNIMDGSVGGFRAIASNQITAASMIFGAWADLIVVERGVLELAVNPFANFQAGIIGVRCMWTVDVAIRRPAFFAIISGVS